MKTTKCKKHPKYRAIRKPTGGCGTCWDIYRAAHQEPPRPKMTKSVRDYLLSRSMHEIIMDYDSLRVVARVAQVLAANSPFINILNAKRRRFPKTESLTRSVFPAGLS